MADLESEILYEKLAMQQKSSLDDIADNISKLIKSESTSLLEEAQRLIDSQLQS